MWRRSTIANRETLTDTEVWEYKLPTSGILNGVFFHIQNTNGSTSNLDNAIAQNINSIEVIDGGRCLFSVTGEQAELLSLLAAGVPGRSVISEGADDVQTMTALILFGHGLWDNELGLDLSKLKNPRVRVDVDFTAVRAAGVTGFVTGSGRMSAVVAINDGAGAPSPGRFLKSAEIKRWTTAASGDETTQGPVDGPWSRLIVRAHVANNNVDDVLTAIKLTFDSGQLVALDERTQWAADGFPLWFGSFPEFAWTLFRADTDTRDLRHGGVVSIGAMPLLDTDVAAAATFEAGRPTFNVNVLGAGTTQTTDGDIFVHAKVAHPFNAFLYDFKDQGLLEVEAFQRADIVLTQAVAAAAASIVLQQEMENTEV